MKTEKQKTTMQLELDLTRDLKFKTEALGGGGGSLEVEAETIQIRRTRRQETERLQALENYDGLNYYRLCNELDVEPEVKELYEQGEMDMKQRRYQIKRQLKLCH